MQQLFLCDLEFLVIQERMQYRADVALSDVLADMGLDMDPSRAENVLLHEYDFARCDICGEWDVMPNNEALCFACKADVWHE